MVEKTFEGFIRPVCTDCGLPVYVNPYPATCQVVRREGSVLLVHRSIDPKRGWWCLPGGFIEWGEHPEEAAKRELCEETNITAKEFSLIGVYDSITGARRHVLLVAYEATAWHGNPMPGDDDDEIAWHPIESLPPLAFSSHDRVLEDIRDGRERR